MRRLKILILVYSLSSCNASKPAKVSAKVYQESGILFFTDREIVRRRTGMDIEYSLNGNEGDYDFFIPYKFKKNQRMCKEEIKTILFSKNEFIANTIYKYSDCSFLERESTILHDCEFFSSDSILNSHGQTIYFAPVEIDYLVSEYPDMEDLTNKGLYTLKIESKNISIKISPRRYSVIIEAVLRNRYECNSTY